MKGYGWNRVIGFLGVLLLLLPLRLEAAEAVEGEILVNFRDHVSAEAVAQLGKRFGLELKLNSAHSLPERLYRAKVTGDVGEMIRRVEAAGGELLEHADRDYLYQASFVPNDPRFKQQWHMDQIRMREAWDWSAGEGVVVAVIDTGVAYRDGDRGSRKFKLVEDLADTKTTEGYDFVNDDALAMDDHGHGTHVAGTIAQSTNNGVGVVGVAYKATIMPLKVLNASGFGNTADIADAIRYAADHGAKVINMSLGGSGRSKVLEDAINHAHSKGVVVVAAAGNSGGRHTHYPAAFDHVIAVSATQFDEALAPYSTYGPFVDIAAPGGNTNLDQNGDGHPDGVLQNTIVRGQPDKSDYYLFQGTSMATPHVAGVAALLVSQGVTDPDRVEEIIQSTARDKGDKGKDERYGAGIVDASKAVGHAKGAHSMVRLGLALLLALAVLIRLRRKSLLAIPLLSPTFWGALILGSVGLFFLPMVGLGQLPGLNFLTHSFCEWDRALLGAASHQNPLLASFLPPLMLVALLYGVKSLKAPLAGFALGVAGFLAHNTLFHLADVVWIPGSLLDRAWQLLGVVICLFLGWAVASRRQS